MDSGYKTQLSDNVYQVRTCAWSPPGDHPVGCGLKVTVEDGKIVHIEGDETHPITNGRLCPRCLAFDEVMYHPDRLLHPMMRAKEDRGKDKWTQITWDEALDIIEEKVNWIKETWGAEAIMVHQGTGREAALYAPAFAPASVGSPNETFTMSGSSCYGPRCCVADFILGAGYPEIDYAQFFEQRYDDPRYELPKYIVLWGKDPLYSSPDGFFGHSLIDMMKRGSQLIVIDPRITWCATRSAFHLQLRPGTDTALGMALLNVVIEEELYDHEFVEKWCYGFDDFAARVREWTPERAEKITWVPAETIRGAARAFATNAPSTIAWGLAIDTSWNGPQAGHCVLALAAICNYIDVPGGLVLAKPASFMGKWRYDCAKMLSDELLAKRIREPQFKGYTYPDSQPDSVFNVYGSGDPYPIKMTWIFSTNMLANTTAAEPHEWYERIKNVEFCVGQDIFMTPTLMALCDIVLPLSTFAEHDGVVLPHFGRNAHFLAAMNKVVEPVDTKSDIEILMWLGKRLNPEEWPWETVDEFFTAQIQTRYDWDFEWLKNEVCFQQPFEYRKYETGGLRDDGEPGFKTPTGLIELKCSLYPNFDEDPLPYFREPYFSPESPEIDEAVKDEYPLVLTTGGRSILFFHSEHRQVPSLRSMNPDPILQINPVDAEAYGIAEGDWVAMENPLGRAVERAHITPVVMPGVVHAQHGWWYPEQDGEEPNLFGVWKSSINSMIPNNKTSILGFGANYKSVICKIYKVDGLDS